MSAVKYVSYYWALELNRLTHPVMKVLDQVEPAPIKFVAGKNKANVCC